ncbi:hypothetical protein KP509_1Z049300 [Ceratopteris richardii]|nr:hypothetical protein KP509_1Z049300 [Ceratopteris richardii]
MVLFVIIQGAEASVNSVLGGYGQINEQDVTVSNEFLTEVLSNMPGVFLQSKHLVALDCAAGIGRVTEGVLLRHFHEVDLVEPVSHLLEAAKSNLGKRSSSLSVLGRAINFYCEPLQEFLPEANRYDVIWVQWCIMHLTDKDVVDFFKRAKAGLKSNGFFIVKENISKHGIIIDKDDSSVTRSDAHFSALFEQAGLFLYKTKAQRGFPRELFPVKMYALTTKLLEDRR